MSRFGGGGSKCTICNKTAYPAETIQFEKKPYHVDCFRCSECDKKLEGAAKASAYEEKIYCQQCFTKGGYAQKQRNVKWVKKESTGTSAIASKFGGGGNPCKVCGKTVYPAETLSFEKQIYHPDCFTCKTCNKKCTPSDAAQFEDCIYCRKCFKEGGFTQKQAATKSSSSSSKANALASRFGGGGTKCVVCDKTVYPAETVSYEKKAYHQDCFKCAECNKKMTPSDAGQFDGKIYCMKCFKAGDFARKQAKV